jgi:DNA helicase-2/ATP-dependent DNA helicase PcrA
VGITRAIKKLSLHSAQKRRIFTKWMVNEKSRFVDEIPSHLLSGSVFKYSKDLEYKSLPREFTQGSLVAHPTFGRGVIKSFENGNSILKAIVDFKEFGKRKISLDHLKHI